MATKRKSLPKSAWAFFFSLRSQLYDKPRAVRLADGDRIAWTPDMLAGIERLGLDDDGGGIGYSSFASESKHDVEMFILGFNAARKMMRTLFVGEK